MELVFFSVYRYLMYSINLHVIIWHCMIFEKIHVRAKVNCTLCVSNKQYRRVTDYCFTLK